MTQRTPRRSAGFGYRLNPFEANPDRIALQSGEPLNEDLYGFNLGYKITFREL